MKEIPEIQKAIKEAKDQHSDIVDSMPDKAASYKQRLLQREHGTPKEFATAVVAAIGEISVLEAQLAIRKYRDEWEAAK